MEKKVIVGGIIALFFVAGLSGCVGPRVTDYFNGSYAASEQTILTVTNINGQVEITGWDGGNVTVNAVKKSSFGKEELDKIKINVTLIGNHLNIETKYTGLATIQGSVDMTIKVPRTIHIESVTTSNGAIQITDTRGDIKTSSSNGAIIIDTVDGYVSAKTSNGRIEVKGTAGIKNIQTSNGAITVEVADFQDNVSIDTSNGAVAVYLNPSVNATLEMTTSNGKITVEGISLNVELLEEAHVIGSLGSGSRRLDIHTSNGNIQLIKLAIQ
ncbi:MAG TPA: hypothetical protein DSN98_07980 [Thermoplasmata archaeon]|nr:MAG TPA: hypothetical protein DSN98_07980 [Thermoplasmata archaeon]